MSWAATEEVSQCGQLQEANMFFLFSIYVLIAVKEAAAQNPYYYVKQCHRADPEVNACLQRSANVLVAYMNRGIPEINLSRPEPVIVDEIGIALGTGPDGYRASFRNIKAYGISNLTVTQVRSDIETNQFQFTFHIPKVSVRAQYESTGILILVQASGGGDYWGEYEGIKAKVYVKGKVHEGEDGVKHLAMQQLKMDFSVKQIQMGVENVHNGNSVIQAALNLFINSNAQELLKEMKPDLKRKLMALMANFINHLFTNVPYDAWFAQ